MIITIITLCKSPTAKRTVAGEWMPRDVYSQWPSAIGNHQCNLCPHKLVWVVADGTLIVAHVLRLKTLYIPAWVHDISTRVDVSVTLSLALYPVDCHVPKASAAHFGYACCRRRGNNGVADDTPLALRRCFVVVPLIEHNISTRIYCPRRGS